MPKQSAHELEGLSLAKSVQLKTLARFDAGTHSPGISGRLASDITRVCAYRSARKGIEKRSLLPSLQESPTVVRDLDVYQKSFDYDIPQLSHCGNFHGTTFQNSWVNCLGDGQHEDENVRQAGRSSCPADCRA